MGMWAERGFNHGNDIAKLVASGVEVVGRDGKLLEKRGDSLTWRDLVLTPREHAPV